MLNLHSIFDPWESLMLEEQPTLSKMSYFVQVRDFARGEIFKRFPWVKNAVKIKHLCGFGDFAENSKSLTNFQDSEDVHEDLISSLD